MASESKVDHQLAGREGRKRKQQQNKKANRSPDYFNGKSKKIKSLGTWASIKMAPVFGGVFQLSTWRGSHFNKSFRSPSSQKKNRLIKSGATYRHIGCSFSFRFCLACLFFPLFLDSWIKMCFSYFRFFSLSLFSFPLGIIASSSCSELLVDEIPPPISHFRVFFFYFSPSFLPSLCVVPSSFFPRSLPINAVTRDSSSVRLSRSTALMGRNTGTDKSPLEEFSEWAWKLQREMEGRHLHRWTTTVYD